MYGSKSSSENGRGCPVPACGVEAEDLTSATLIQTKVPVGTEVCNMICGFVQRNGMNGECMRTNTVDIIKTGNVDGLVQEVRRLVEHLNGRKWGVMGRRKITGFRKMIDV